MLSAAVQDLAARDVLSRFIATRAATMSVIVDRAVGRGELPPGADAGEVIQVVTAQLFYRLFIVGEPISQVIADRAAATAAAAARAGALGAG
jgi:Tetracyclin repressor-like, C-terminal domain